MARVETLPTLTVVAVIPVWSLKALAGIVLPPFDDELPPADVVVVVDELVELQATAVVATTMTIASAARRVFHGAEPKAPPCCRSWSHRAGTWWSAVNMTKI